MYSVFYGLSLVSHSSTSAGAHLVLIDLEEHSVQDEAGGLGHVEGLLCLGQPVDGVLQRGLEACGQ